MVWVMLATGLRIAFETPAIPQLTDETGYFVWQWSWMVDRDVDPTNQFAARESGYFPQFFDHPDGRSVRVNKYSTGMSLAIVPVTGLAYAGSQFYQWIEGAKATDLETLQLLTRAGWFANALWSIIGLVACYRVARYLTSPAAAAIATFAAWAGTSAFAYTWKLSLYSHGVGMSVLAIIAYVAIVKIGVRTIARGGIAWGVGLGFLASLALMIRPTNAILLLPLALFMLRKVWIAWQLRHGATAGFALATVIGMFPPIALEGYTRWSNYGSVFFNGYAHNGESFDFRSPHVWNVLTYLEKLNSFGLGVWSAHPMTLVAIGGLLVAAYRSKPHRLLSAAMLLSLGLTVYIYGAWSCWNLGFSYGARWASDLLVIWTLGIAWLIHYTSNKPRRAAIYVVPLVVWSLGVCWTSMLPPDAPAQQIVTVPQE